MKGIGGVTNTSCDLISILCFVSGVIGNPSNILELLLLLLFIFYLKVVLAASSISLAFSHVLYLGGLAVPPNNLKLS